MEILNRQVSLRNVFRKGNENNRSSQKNVINSDTRRIWDYNARVL